MARQTKTNGGKSPLSPLTPVSKDGDGEAADLARLHLRYDKELNKAHPLDEEICPKPASREGD